MAEIQRYTVKIHLKYHKALRTHKYKYTSKFVSVLHKIMDTHTGIYKPYGTCFNKGDIVGSLFTKRH